MRAREPCGCVHDGHKWLDMCDVHRAEFNDTHERWAIEHIERQPIEPSVEALAVTIGKVLIASGAVVRDEAMP